MLCPICESKANHALCKEGHDYFRCQECDFLFHRSRGKSIAFYDKGYWDMESAEALRREKEDSFHRALELIYLSSIKVENVLDFGCGLGMTVRLLRDKLGLNAVGVDISANFESAPYLHKCDLAELVKQYPAGHFDAIYSIEVFEHLENPRNTLTELHALLKPGGKILINTGTQEYLARFDPEMNYVDPVRRGHISIYSLKAFSRLASCVGYSAAFLAARKYAVVLSPAGSESSSPRAENLEIFRRLGEWAPSLLREYMRLVYLEEEFEIKSAWAYQMMKQLEAINKAK